MCGPTKQRTQRALESPENSGIISFAWADISCSKFAFIRIHFIIQL